MPGDAWRQGPARPPLWAIPLSKVRVIAKDTLDYTFSKIHFITFHRCIFEVYLRVYLECISAPGAPGPVAEGAGGRVPRVLALAWLGLTHRAHRDDWLRGEGVVAHGERDYRHTRHTGTRERRLWRLRRRGRERRPLRPPGLLARLLGLPLCRHLLQPREGGLSAARMGAGSGAHLRGAARLASCRRRQLRPVLVVVGQLGGRLLGCRAVRAGQVALNLLANRLELGAKGVVAR